MANKIVLPEQKMKLKDLLKQFPSTGSSRRKIFFQTELRAVDKGEATFGVIAYPGWKEPGQRWNVGQKVLAQDTEPGKPKSFSDPFAFANNEILISKGSKNVEGKAYKKTSQAEFMELIKKILADKELLKKSALTFDAKISDNPHLVYDVTLEVGDGTSVKVRANPSPPRRPEEGD